MNDLIRRDQVMDCINELWRRGEFTPENVAMSINALCDVDAVILPCKVDDDVFIIIAGMIFPFSVISIMLHTNTPTFKAQHGINLVWVFGPYDIGKSVFLTREEAEAALAKMKG